MWPFRRKNKSSGTSYSSNEIPEPHYTVTPTMVEETVHAYFGSGRRFALFYANMCGMQTDRIPGDRFHEFFTLINEEPAFTTEGIRYAANRVVSDMDVGVMAADTLFYGVSGERNKNLRPTIEAVRKEAEHAGYGPLFDAVGFDPGSFLTKTVVSLRRSDIDRVIAKLDEKRDFLKPLLRRALLKGKNKYGEVEYDEFWQEITQFVSHFFPEGSLEFFYDLIPSTAISAHVLPWLQDEQDMADVPQDGVDFEHWCAEQLDNQGWKCVVSKASGDQGVDIVAHHVSLSVAIQCKRYHQPIGNKAVQEAYAGMVHYQTDAACVLGTGGFTKSAQELAQNTGVILIDAEHIADFTELFLHRNP